MGRSLSDPKLGEVRAVLERLQTFAADPDGTQPPAEASDGSGFNGHATSAHRPGIYERVYELAVRKPAEYDVGDESASRRRAPAVIGLGIAGTVVILLGVVWLIVS